MGVENNISKRMNSNSNSKSEINMFEYTLNRLLCIKESLDSFLKIIDTPSYNSIHKIKAYLNSGTEAELEDWVNALEIAVVDREQINRWTLALANITKEMPISSRSKSVLAGVLEALNATDYMPRTETEI